MATIKKKLWKEYFDAINSGRKNFELRLNDFDIQEGDTLILEEWDKDKRKYTGRSITRTVMHVSKFKLEDIYAFNSEEEFKEKGIQVISLM